MTCHYVSHRYQFLPGQWLDTYVPGVSQAGGFTITSPPAAATSSASPYLELAVQESPGNPPAAWLWHEDPDALLGETLQVRIGGSFAFPPRDRLDGIDKVVFVAGGVGVNPIMSMLSHIASTPPSNPGLRFEIAYASRVSDEGIGKILFLERIDALLKSGKVPGSLALFLTSGKEEISEDERRSWVDRGHVVHKRRIAQQDLRDLVGGDPEHTVVYICGPPVMTDEAVDFLTSPEGLGMDKSRVMIEKWW